LYSWCPADSVRSGADAVRNGRETGSETREPPDVLLAELQRSPALLLEFLRALASRVRGMSRREAGVRQEHRDLRHVLETCSHLSTGSSTIRSSRSMCAGAESGRRDLAFLPDVARPREQNANKTFAADRRCR
jgi:hypothetical protein